MGKVWHKFISLFLSGVILGGVLGLSLCLHSLGQWHVVSVKTHAPEKNVQMGVLYDTEQGYCWDVGFDSLADASVIRGLNFAKVLLISTPAFIDVSVGEIPKPEFSISSFKTAPPEISFEGVNQNIVSRLLI